MLQLPAELAILADDPHKIAYRPALNPVTGGTLQTIFLLRVLYWWVKSKREPFYKFSAPCEHEDYRESDSWQEELGFTRSEFETARAGVAVKITRNSNKEDLAREWPVFYWTTIDRRTYYQVNEERLLEMVAQVYGSGAIRNAGFQQYVVRESRTTKCDIPALDHGTHVDSHVDSHDPSGEAHASPVVSDSAPVQVGFLDTPPKQGKPKAKEDPLVPKLLEIYVEAVGGSIPWQQERVGAKRTVAHGRKKGWSDQEILDNAMACYRYYDGLWRTRVSLQSVASNLGKWETLGKPGIQEKPSGEPVAPKTYTVRAV